MLHQHPVNSISTGERLSLWIAGLLFIATSSQVIACSPPPPRPPRSAEAIVKEIDMAIKRSDVILDALVDTARDGQVSLTPVRIYKGPRRPSYLIINQGCGVFFPQDRRHVRVLLENIDDGWLAISPGSFGDATQFEREVDAYIGRPLPRGYASIGGVTLPPPPR